MSQSSLVEDFVKWTTEECQLNASSALPKLINSIKSDDIGTVELTSLILKKFAAALNVTDLEKYLFAKLSQKICDVFDHLFETIVQIVSTRDTEVQNLTSEAVNIIQCAVTLVEGLECCVQHVISQGQQVRLEEVHSLLPTLLHTIHTSYLHCKNSSDIYGQFLGLLSEQLSTLFKTVHRLQMVVVSLIEKLSVGSDLDEIYQQDLIQVVVRLHAIGEIAGALDVKINVTLWKVVARLCSQYKCFLQNVIDCCPVLQSLCTQMTSSFHYIGQVMPTNESVGDVKAFSKHLKILGFYMKILNKLVDDFSDSLSKSCVENVYRNILLFQRHNPPSLRAQNLPETTIKEIQNQLTNGIEPLVAKLITNKLFLEVMTTVEPSVVADGLHLAHCMTLLMVTGMIDSLPSEMRSAWISGTACPEDCQRWSLLKAIFHSVQHCYTELSVCLMVPDPSSGSSNNQRSLYQWIYIRTCVLIATYSQADFIHLEELLLEYVLQPSSHVAVLAIDVWCFLARYGSATLCRDHCVFLSRLLITSGLTASPQCCHLVCLLRRLLKFLAPEHQSEYISAFPVSRHLHLWSVIPLHTFSGHTCQQVVEQIVSSCTEILQQLYSSGTAGKLTWSDSVRGVDCVRCLVNAVSNPFIVDKYLERGHLECVLDTSVNLLTTLQTHSVLHCVVLQCTVSSTLELLAWLVSAGDWVQNPHILQVMSVIEWLVRRDEAVTSCVNIQLSSLTFLQTLTSKMISPTTEQPKILRLLREVFGWLLSDSNVVVKQTAMQVFGQFAEETPHESIVAECLSNEQLQTDIVTYLSQVESGSVTSEVRISDWNTQKTVVQDFTNKPLSHIYIPATQHGCTDKPMNKRMKLETAPVSEQDTELKKSLKALSDGALGLMDLSATCHIPDWAKSEIKNCQDILNKVL